MSTPTTDRELIDIRRHLHANPELSQKEEKTAEFIERRLQDFGFNDIQRVADTGVVALLEGANEGPCRGYRADIDALPIQEANDVDYCSTNPGVMHACGHDVHTTVGLGVARQLQQRRDELEGSVKLIFQPAEEATPEDEPVGAERMVQQGVLEAPEVDAVFALHCMPSLPVGHIGYTGGPVWAGSELLEIEIRGKKSHGAYPHEGVDAVAVGSQVVVALQQVVSRNLDARDCCVISIGHIEAGNTYNVLADTAKMTGIVRGLSEKVIDDAQAAIQRTAEGVAAALGAEAIVRFTSGARPVINDVQLETAAVDVIRQRVGASVPVAHPPQLGAEDFSAFSRRVPGCYLFLGIRNEDRGIVHPLHTPEFDVDEDCIATGVAAMTEVLLHPSHCTTSSQSL